MALTISSLELYQFRNYPTLQLPELGKNIIFVGENGVGKTNILEAIHLVTACQSFRHASLDQLVYTEAIGNQARVSVELSDDTRRLSVDMLLVDKKRQYKLNGKGKRVGDIRGLVPSVTFTPDDLFLIKGPHKDRRAALDTLGVQLRPNYQSVKSDYDTILRHKNKLLKEGAPEAYLASVNEIMVTCGAQLSFYRASLFDRLAPKIIAHYQQLSQGKEQLTCEYCPSWVLHGKLDDNFFDETIDLEDFSLEDDVQKLQKNFAANADKENPGVTHTLSDYVPISLTRDTARQAMKTALNNRLNDEILRQRTVVGPHMDTVTFYLNGRPAADFASQGQQRTIVLAWKLAEVELIGELLGTHPILLLDDVMSELDGNRRAALEDCISTAPQTFITTTNPGYFTSEMLDLAQIISLPFTN